MLNSNSGADLMGEVDMRAKSTLEVGSITSRNHRNGIGYESTFGKTKASSSPFSTTGSRFNYIPAAKKEMLRSPSPGERLHHDSSFKKQTVFEKSPSSFSFGMSRLRMQNTGHDS